MALAHIPPPWQHPQLQLASNAWQALIPQALAELLQTPVSTVLLVLISLDMA